MKKTHVILNYRSDVRSFGTNNEPIVVYKKPITFEKLNKGRQYALRLENMILPTSFYQVTSSYYTFEVIETNGVTPYTVTINITQGNYNATELAAEVETKLTAASIGNHNAEYVVAFDAITGKMNISYSGGSATSVTVQSQTTSTLNPFMGFGEVGSTTTTTFGPTGTDGPNQVNLTVIDYIDIELTNIASHNHFSKDRQINIGARINISEERGDKIQVDNHMGIMVRYSANTKFTRVKTKLLDPYGNSVDLNGVPFSFQMVFYEIE